ncbi:hypothetical protein D3C80_683340 [compost metagenome]
MTAWADQVRWQTRLVINQIAEMRARLPQGTGEQALETYYRMLEELFEKDLRLAQLRDDSDLLLRAEGEAFLHDPKLQLVTSIFSNVTNQVTGLAKAILGVRAEGAVTPSMVDLGLSGIAKGSLYFGLKAQTPDLIAPLLGEADAIFDSTKRALKIIDDVAHIVEVDDEHVSVEAVSEIVEDPKVRDAAMVAVQRISPSGRRGFDSVSVSGGEKSPAELRPSHRRAIRESLDKPVIRGEEIQFTGQVREIDLDAFRFELRGIADHQIRDLRCAYRGVEGVQPRKLLGSTVRVRGLVERSANDIPRLMSIRELTIVRDAPDHLK